MSFKMCCLKDVFHSKRVFLWLLLVFLTLEATSGLRLRRFFAEHSPSLRHTFKSSIGSPIIVKSSLFYNPSNSKISSKSEATIKSTEVKSPSIIPLPVSISSDSSETSATAFLAFDESEPLNQLSPEYSVVSSPESSSNQPPLYHQAMIITGSKSGGIRLRPVSSLVSSSSASSSLVSSRDPSPTLQSSASNSHFKPNWASMLHRPQTTSIVTKRRPIFSSTSTTQASVEEINASVVDSQVNKDSVVSPTLETSSYCCGEVSLSSTGSTVVSSSKTTNKTSSKSPSKNAERSSTTTSSTESPIKAMINDIESTDPLVAEESFNEETPIIVSSNHKFQTISRKKITVVQETSLGKETPDPWSLVTPSTSSFTEYPKDRVRVTTRMPSVSTSSHSTHSFHDLHDPASRITMNPPYTEATTRPSSLSLSTPASTSIVSMMSNRPKVTSVSNNRSKPPDRIESPSMTVLDSNNQSFTIVHQKLIVPYKPGRPKPGVSSIGLLASQTNNQIRQKPNTTETGEVINPSDDAELTTYYPQGLFRPTTLPPQPWTCAPLCHEDTSTSSPFVTHVTSTTADPFLTLESQHTFQTKRPIHHGFQPATVNAILAPPMPSRPISTPAPIGNTGIFSSLMGVLGVDSTGGLMSRLTLLKTALFTLLVMFLPPLTLAAAVAQLL